MLQYSGDLSTNPLPRLAGSSGLSGSLGRRSQQLTPVESFKHSIKGDSIHFSNFKEGKYWDAWRRNTLATARAQDAYSVLKTD